MRLFISVPLDADFAGKVAEVQRELKAVCAGGRFPPQENLHITLAFIGEVPDCADAKAALKTIRFEKTEIKNRRNRALWKALYAESRIGRSA